MAPTTFIAQANFINLRNNTHPQWWKDPGLIRLNFLLFGTMLGSVVFGFDQALIGGLLADKRWYMDLRLTSNSLQGLVIAAVSFGLMAALFPAAYIIDLIGRRWSIILANVALVAGAIGQAFSNTAIQFLGTRILLGFMGAVTSTGSTSLLAELAHPRQRAQVTAMYMTCFYVGAITAAWSCYGTLNFSSSWSWRLPVILQVPWSVMQVAIIIICPESPRWLATKGKEVEAKAVLTKYHANGADDDQLVEFEFQEILASIRADVELGRNGWRSWLALFSTAGNLKRTFLVIFLGLAVQWVGNGIISYYLPAVLATVGVTSPIQQQGLNGGLQIWNLFMALIGALLAEKVGRKRLLVISAAGMLVSMILITACSAIYAKNPLKSAGAGKAVIFFIFSFFGAYDIGFTPIPPLYVSELAPTSMRAKYLSLFMFSTAAALCFNQYVNPTALAAIQWKYYFVYIGVLVAVIIILSLFAPETKGMSLEEVSSIFDKKIAEELAEIVGVHQNDINDKADHVITIETIENA